MTDPVNATKISPSSGDSDQFSREKTPIYIGPGIVIEGRIIDSSDDPALRIVILGTLRGGVQTKGVLQIAQGGLVELGDSGAGIDCGHIILAGEIKAPGLTIHAGAFSLEETGGIEADTLCVPSGRFSTAIGGILNTKVDMRKTDAQPAVTAKESPRTPPQKVTALHAIPGDSAAVAIAGSSLASAQSVWGADSVKKSDGALTGPDA